MTGRADDWKDERGGVEDVAGVVATNAGEASGDEALSEVVMRGAADWVEQVGVEGAGAKDVAGAAAATDWRGARRGETEAERLERYAAEEFELCHLVWKGGDRSFKAEGT